MAVIKLGAVKLLRVGGKASITAELFDELRRTGKEEALLAQLASSGIGFAEFTQRVRSAEIIAATAYQCVSHPLFIRERFDRVVIDEAGQLDEPSTLGPLALAPKFILGGDHLQLPPIVQSNSEKLDGVGGLEVSLFERLFLTGDSGRIFPN